MAILERETGWMETIEMSKPTKVFWWLGEAVSIHYISGALLALHVDATYLFNSYPTYAIYTTILHDPYPTASHHARFCRKYKSGV